VIEVLVEDDGWRTVLPSAAALAKAAARAVLKAEALSMRTGLCLLLTSDARQQALNTQFRGKPATTNVLSFPAPEGTRGHLGDVSLALGVCAREASGQGKPLAAHLQHLTAHGVLHLLGYDHQTSADADSMEAKERAILAQLGVPDPYAERGDQGDHGQHGQ